MHFVSVTGLGNVYLKENTKLLNFDWFSIFALLILCMKVVEDMLKIKTQ